MVALMAEPIPLQGTKNTRDLGGLPIRGGHLRSGKLFRSGALCFLTPSDQERVQELGLQTLIDLRVQDEICKDGCDRVQAETSNYHWPMRSSHGRGAEAYRSLLLENPRVLREFFRHLSQPDSFPMLFHCSAGKDRTGILTALLLDGLGCPRSVIRDDYLQSRRNHPKLHVEEDWLEEVFQAVDRVGGTRAFLAIYGVAPELWMGIEQNLLDSSGFLNGQKGQ
jgi:protein-tyrosine phosphatase